MKTAKKRKPKTPYRPPYKYVEVVWDDASSNSDTWVAVDDVQKPEQVITRGWLVVDHPKYVSIASSVANEDEHEDTVGNTITIPRGMIVGEVVEMRLVPVKPKKVRAKPDLERQAEEQGVGKTHAEEVSS